MWKLLLKVTAPCMLLLLALPHPASGEYIRIVATPQAVVDDQAMSVDLSIEITNEGDEPATEVSVAFPLLNQSFKVKELLATNEKVKFQKNFSFEELKIDIQGAYDIPFHITYKDVNFYPFSAPFLKSIVHRVAPTSALSVTYPDLQPGSAVSLEKRAALEVKVVNTTEQPVRINALAPFTASEISVSTVKLPLPTTLKPKQALPLTLTVVNSGALAGSEYQAFLLFSGEFGDKHFAESSRFRVRIEIPRSYSTEVLAIIFVVIPFVLLGIWLFGRRKKQEN